MEVKFIGSLSEIKSEMQEFLDSDSTNAAPDNGGSKSNGSKSNGSKKAPAKVEKVTADTIREAMLACDNKEGKKSLLADYGASKISELDEDKYEEFLAAVKAL